MDLQSLIYQYTGFHIEALNFFLWLLSVIFGLTLFWVHYKSSDFDLRDILRDDLSGKASLHKLGQLVALMATTWGFIHLVVNNQLTETYLFVYTGLWAGAEAVNAFQKYVRTKQKLDSKE